MKISGTIEERSVSIKRRYGSWHFKLRQARNGTPRFFEIMAGEA